MNETTATEPTVPASERKSQTTTLNNSATKYSVGIDLGTTHCLISYIKIPENDLEEPIHQMMEIPQLTAAGLVEHKTQLASFLYLAHSAEMSEGTNTLPWTANPEYLVGEIARNRGRKTPLRLVSSAKSWLSHAGVDCKSAILPPETLEDVKRISPYETTVALLQHLRNAWDHHYPDSRLADQDLTITVPASFDPAARGLTVEAARELALTQVILLEEPQSVFYSWIEKSHGDWRNQVSLGDIILVIDIGGGTTDMSLIAVTDNQGNLELTRVAVGDHILLGGDNMDLALAYTIKVKLEKTNDKLAPWQLQALTHSCREAKEKIFNDQSLESVPIIVANRGSSLIGGALRTDLTREEVDQVLVKGFLPKVKIGQYPASRTRSGLRTTGLPYAQDAGITRHLAAFLTRQVDATKTLTSVEKSENVKFLHPTAVLFNGGVLKAKILSDRIMSVLNTWLTDEGAEPARLLDGTDLDTAVARGAAYFGFVRKQKGVRIHGGTAAAYYVGVESAMPSVPGMPPEVEALCVAPFGMEAGTEDRVENDEFGLVVGEPVRFRFYSSNVRRKDVVGTRLDFWSDNELEELYEIEITLAPEAYPVGDIVPVQLRAVVTEVGTLELIAYSSKDNNSWKIEFDVRVGEN